MGDDELLEAVRGALAAPVPEPVAPDLPPGIRLVRIELPIDLPRRDEAPARDRPPASLDAVRAVEQELGVRLPPLLVRLYTEVADGGFGPGDGAVPVSELPELWEDHAVGLVESEDLDPWPAGVIPFCNIDQTLLACVDCGSPDGRVIGFEFDDLDPDAPGALAAALSEMAPSLREWLEGWLAER